MNILMMDPGQKVASYYKENKQDVIAYCIVVLFSFIVYGSKLFFTSYAADDYARLFFDTKVYAQSAQMGRWGASFLNSTLFSGRFHILPYCNTIISLLCLSAAGLLTAKFWGVQRRFGLVVASLLMVVSPSFVHNIYFNTNVSVGVGVLIMTSSLFLAPRGWRYFLPSLLLGAFSISIYQTNLQVGLVIIFVWAILKILNGTPEEQFRQLGKQFVILFLFLCGSYVVYEIINKLIILGYDLSLHGRYLESQSLTLAGLGKNIARALSPFPAMNLMIFYLTPNVVFSVGLLGFLGVSYDALKRQKRNYWVIGLFMALLVGVKLAVDLPLIMGFRVMTRAYYPVGWVFAGFFIVLTLSRFPMVRFVGSLMSVVMIVMSFVYASAFYDSANRQTQADIIRINQIVTEIRLHEDYKSLKGKLPYFLILGEKKFSVEGWEKGDQILNTSWSKYEGFKYFTDFKFKRLNAKKAKLIIKKLKQYDGVREYPERGGIQVVGDTVVLILDDRLL